MDITAEKLDSLELPLVSITMLTYNRATLLPRALESVLAQSYTQWECLVVDDGSTDETPELMRSYADPRIRYLRHDENAGIIARRNEAVQEARGAYIAVLDSDDWWIDPRKLEKQVGFLKANPDHVLVGTQATLIKGSHATDTSYPLTDRAIRTSILSKNQFANSTTLFVRAALPTPPYDTETYLVEDYALWLELGQRGKFANLPDVTTRYLINPDGQMARAAVAPTRASFELIQKYRSRYPGYYRAHITWHAKLALRTLLAISGR